MTFSWEDFRTLAADLETAQDEASKRTAISRAYYFAYHTAKQHMVGQGVVFDTNGPKSHEVVWSKLKNEFGSAGKTAAGHGTTLKDWRLEADYKRGQFDYSQHAKLCLQSVETFARCLSQAKRAPRR